MDRKTIVRYISYAVAGVTLLSLVSTNFAHVLLLAASAGAYFVSEKL